MTPKHSSKRTLFLVAGLTAALAATTALSAPRALGPEAMQPPSAAELGLSPAHARQWDALRGEALALRQVGREDLRDGFGELRVLLDQPSPDLRAFSRESQRRVDAHMAEARALRERQLDLYESLSPAEQARVRKAMAERLDRFARIRERIAAFVEARG
jgi:hypothetical protein